MLDPTTRPQATPAGTTQPQLTIVVDTEEEFDWSQPLDRRNTSVSNIRHQVRAHRIFETHGVKPTYVVDYAVASQPDGYKPLKELFDSGQCEIGAHLHPWVNPPHDETVTNRNSYPGNLPPELEREKLRVLTETIAENFGTRPTIYKAGRYGVGPSTPAILRDLGYAIDCSVVPHTDFSPGEGPNFLGWPDRPYVFGEGGALFEVPLTVGFAGALARLGPRLYPAISGPAAMKVRLPGVFARSRLLERIRLSPEGANVDELLRLTRAARRAGHASFSFTYHSPSLDPGHTPYVRTAADLDRFLATIETYVAAFVDAFGGRPASLAEVRAASCEQGAACLSS